MSGLLKNNGKDISRSGGGLAALMNQNKKNLGAPIALPDTEFHKNFVAARIGFLIDATGSRSEAWNEATKIQSKMFDTMGQSSHEIHLVYFGGNQIHNGGWHKSSNSLTRAMSDVECWVGRTQIVSGLDIHLQEDKKPDVLIVIGDAFEENEELAYQKAQKLGEKGVKIFTFLEDEDYTAKRVFKGIAALSGGGFAQFGQNMRLDDLCQAVKAYASYGVDGLKLLAQSGNKGALFLGRDMKLIS